MLHSKYRSVITDTQNSTTINFPITQVFSRQFAWSDVVLPLDNKKELQRKYNFGTSAVIVKTKNNQIKKLEIRLILNVKK